MEHPRDLVALAAREHEAAEEAAGTDRMAAGVATALFGSAAIFAMLWSFGAGWIASGLAAWMSASLLFVLVPFLAGPRDSAER
jgi:hypothetical protein